MRIAYFDCFSGASGDMILGAMVDAGLSLDDLLGQLRQLPIPEFDVSAERVQRKGLAATQITVHAVEERTHRHLPTIIDIIERAKLGRRITANAGRVFGRLAEAEAAVHGCAIDEVHFHEVGAVDAIVDIVGACIGLDCLGIEQVVCSAIPVGSGTVSCEHGVLPIPAPATACLLAGFPIAECPETGELTTPTAAALLTTLADRFGSLPSFTLRATGSGAGRREGRTRANLLRVLIGESAAGGAATEEILVLEASLDDQSPEITAFASELLLAEGALDVYCQPILMKKGRPGVLMTVLCRPEHADALEAILFAETTTLGVRRQRVQRTVLERRIDEIEVLGGTVRMKVAIRDNGLVNAAPEFEDCRRLAEASGRPLRDVMTAALAAWQAARGCAAQ